MSVHLNNTEKEKIKKFVFFLKKKNIYGNYIFNLRTLPKHLYNGSTKKYEKLTLSLLVRYYPMSEFFTEAFHTYSTTEGHQYWCNIEKEWRTFLYYSWDKERKTYNNHLTRNKKKLCSQI